MNIQEVIRRISRANFAALDGGDDEMLHCLEQLLKNRGGALVAAGLTLREPGSVVARRMVSFALRGRPVEETWVAWTLLLLPPFETDTTVLLNTLAGVREVAKGLGDYAAVPQSLMPGFLLHALGRPAVVAERAVSVALGCPAAAWPPSEVAQRTQLAEALDRAVSALDEPVLRQHWASPLGEQRAALASPHHRKSVVRARLALAEALDSVPLGYARELAGEASEYVEAYLATGAKGVIRPVQRLQLTSGSSLSTAVWDVVRAWTSFFELVAQGFYGTDELALEPSNAATGSLLVDHVVSMPASGEDVEGLSQSLQEALSARVSDNQLATLHRLLDSMAADRVSLRAKHYWGRRAGQVVERKPKSVRELRIETARQRPSQVPSRDIPQADRLEKVVHLVALISDGSLVGPVDIGMSTTRQLDYYKRAAKILGLLDEDSEPTPAGKHLLRLGAPEQWRLLSVLFETSRCGAAWVEWSGGRTLLDVEPGSARDFVLQRGIGVNGETVGRRVQSLRSWLDTFRRFHYSA